MSAARYALGIAALACVCGSLGVGAAALRARLLPAWSGGAARLAESVIGLALLVAILELLGLVGLFRLGPVVGLCLLVGLGLARGTRAPVARLPSAPLGASPLSEHPLGASPLSEHPLGLAAALGSSGLLFAEWAVPTLHSYDGGIGSLDSLWYHLPWAAAFAQSGHVTPLHFTDVEYLTAFYPATGELFHGLGIVLVGRDVLSPGLNLVFLGLVLLAAWCVGAPRRLGAATLTGAALALALPMMRFSQGGSAANDVLGVFFLVAAVALLINADSGVGLVLAALSAGLALSVKLSLLTPVLTLSVAAAILSPVGQRRVQTGRWAACLLMSGGFWYVRNLIAVGNPLPWLSLGILPTPAPPLQAHTALSVVRYLGDGRAWNRVLQPGLADGLGPLWPLILGAAILGPVACVWRSTDTRVRLLGLVALASLVAYVCTPESAAGPVGHPAGFAFNLRYAAPALTLGITLLPLAAERDGKRAHATIMTVLVLLLAGTLAQSRLWPAGYVVASLLVGAVVAAALATSLVSRNRRPPTRTAGRGVLLAGVCALLAAGGALGYAGERHYLHGRYMYQPRVSSLATLWQWFRRIHGARVGLVGTFGGFFSYPLFGLDDSNRVAYVARRGAHGSFTTIGSCSQWRRALDVGRYRYVVTTPARDPWRPKRLTSSPEDAWTASDPAARLVFRSTEVGQHISVYELSGDLNPAGCGTRSVVESPRVRLRRAAGGARVPPPDGPRS